MDQTITYEDQKNQKSILLCSTSPLKLQAVTELATELFPNYTIDTFDCSELNLPSQPINSAEKCAYLRLLFAKKEQDKERNKNYDLIIAIESGIYLGSCVKNEECWVVIDDNSVISSGYHSFTIHGEEEKLLIKHYHNDFSISLGANVTFGELLHQKDPSIDPKNWMKTLYDIDRVDMMKTSIKEALKNRRFKLDQIDIVNKSFRVHEDFPKPGVTFQDLFPVLANKETLQILTNIMVSRYYNYPFQIDYIVGMESRGFFGILMAAELAIGFIPIRKAGKLPGKVESIEYGTEYSKDKCEITTDIPIGSRVILFDDLIATGGSLKAGVSLLERLNCTVVDICVLKEVSPLREKARNTLGRSYTVLLK